MTYLILRPLPYYEDKGKFQYKIADTVYLRVKRKGSNRRPLKRFKENEVKKI